MIPYEDDEQKVLVQWLESVVKLKFTAVPNSTWTPSWKQRMKNKAMGLRKGMSDLIIYIKKEQSKYDRPLLLFVEMKRQKGAYATPEQKEWLRCLNQLNDVQCEVCNGYEKAKIFILKFIKT